MDFIGQLPTNPGNYYWPDQVIGSHLKYFDGTSDWYAFSTTTGHEITRVEIVAGTLSTYACTGFADPFAAPISLKKHVQRVIPLKAQLLESGGRAITDTSIAGAVAPTMEVTFSSISGDGVDVTSELLSPGQASSGNSFSFDPETSTWQFNLGTGSFTVPGTYTVTLKSGNVERYQVNPTCTGTFVRQ